MGRGASEVVVRGRSGWGGRREGAGRKPKGDRAGVSHMSRPAVARRFPVHVTLRVLPHVGDLRGRRALPIVHRALTEGGERFGVRICEFAVQGNQVELIAEAMDGPSLSRGMQGLCIRLAKGLNEMMGRRGKVLADRFDARVLRTPSEVTEARRSLVTRHDDRRPSARPKHGVPMSKPRTTLLLHAQAAAPRR
jgi:hypothetical protein